MLKQFCALNSDGVSFMRSAMERLHLSARAFTRVLKVAGLLLIWLTKRLSPWLTWLKLCSIVLNKKGKVLLDVVERIDSTAVDPHFKVQMVPVDLPVVLHKAIGSPWLTACPLLTYNLALWPQRVTMPLP